MVGLPADETSSACSLVGAAGVSGSIYSCCHVSPAGGTEGAERQRAGETGSGLAPPEGLATRSRCRRCRSGGGGSSIGSSRPAFGGGPASAAAWPATARPAAMRLQQRWWWHRGSTGHTKTSGAGADAAAAHLFRGGAVPAAGERGQRSSSCRHWTGTSRGRQHGVSSAKRAPWRCACSGVQRLFGFYFPCTYFVDQYQRTEGR